MNSPKSDFRNEHVKERRNKLGLSQEGLADRMKALGCPVSAQTICNWETGANHPMGNRLAALAAALEVPIAFLFVSTALRYGEATSGPKNVTARAEGPSRGLPRRSGRQARVKSTKSTPGVQ